MTAPFPNPHFAISLYCSDFRNPAPQVEYLNTVADSYHVDIMGDLIDELENNGLYL